MKKPYVTPEVKTLKSREVLEALGPASAMTSPQASFPPGD
jgi:hypothetical protein